MGDCYRYEVLNETSFPIMKNVDVAIILIMEGSTRLKKDPFLLNLAKKTVIQYNKGFKNCDKPEVISKSNHDINHAFLTAFNYTQNLENVIVFEEDAEILNYNIRNYKIIDDYISKNNYSAISFWSDSLLEYYNDHFYKTIGNVAAAQAILYSKSEREKISEAIINGNYDGHFDSHYLKDILVFNEPLIVQLHPNTENFNNWNNGDVLINNLTRFLFIVSGRDKYKNSVTGFHNLRKTQCYLRNNKLLVLFLTVILILIAKIYLY